jgi:hypothetical protein
MVPAHATRPGRARQQQGRTIQRSELLVSHELSAAVSGAAARPLAAAVPARADGAGPIHLPAHRCRGPGASLSPDKHPRAGGSSALLPLAAATAWLGLGSRHFDRPSLLPMRVALRCSAWTCCLGSTCTKYVLVQYPRGLPFRAHHATPNDDVAELRDVKPGKPKLSFRGSQSRVR